MLGPRHPDTLNLISNFVELLRELGRIEEALVSLGNSISATREVLGLSHALTLTAEAKAARLLMEVPSLSEKGRQVLVEVLPRMEEVFGKKHHETARYRKLAMLAADLFSLRQKVTRIEVDLPEDLGDPVQRAGAIVIEELEESIRKEVANM